MVSTSTVIIYTPNRQSQFWSTLVFKYWHYFWNQAAFRSLSLSLIQFALVYIILKLLFSNLDSLDSSNPIVLLLISLVSLKLLLVSYKPLKKLVIKFQPKPLTKSYTTVCPLDSNPLSVN